MHADEITTVNMSTSNSFSESLPETRQPLILREISGFFPCSWTFEFDPGEILKMVDHLMHKD